MSKRIRPLPVAIFAAVLFLTVRLGNLWQDLTLQVGAESAAQAAAKPAAPSPPAKPAPAAAAPATNAPGAQAANPPSPANPAAAQAANPPAALPAGPAADPQAAALPLDLTDSEIGLLQSLAQRREALDQRAHALELREGLLQAAEKRLDAKIAKLGELQTTLQGLLKQYDTKSDAQLQSLVKIYETMKPKDAARIWNELEMPVLLQVVERMREMKAAPILAAMNPDAAKRVTDELIRRRQLPGSPLAGGNG
jgi:flagellar motility protein MotE (MotC chaperone)